ncbi:MAG: hypothetical protein J6B79_06775 [Clostridia bacterium]|nr:hypothetical protein [Clostridia bacterium]
MKKKTKFSLGMKIVTLLTVITMASVGFAAWVITAPVVEKETAGAIVVDTVEEPEDPSLVFGEPTWVNAGDKTATAVGENLNKVYFGKPAESDYADDIVENPWLTNNSSDTEKMKAYLKVQITVNVATDISIAFKTYDVETDAITDDFSTYSNYITPNLSVKAYNGENEQSLTTNFVPDKPDEHGNQYCELVISSDGLTAGMVLDVYITIEFEWGDKFGTINPYNHYNKNEYNATLAQEAYEALKKINELNGVGYKVIIDKKAA